mgnify:CR=1 FL=1
MVQFKNPIQIRELFLYTRFNSIPSLLVASPDHPFSLHHFLWFYRKSEERQSTVQLACVIIIVAYVCRWPNRYAGCARAKGMEAAWYESTCSLHPCATVSAVRRVTRRKKKAFPLILGAALNELVDLLERAYTYWDRENAPFCLPLPLHLAAPVGTWETGNRR